MSSSLPLFCFFFACMSFTECNRVSCHSRDKGRNLNIEFPILSLLRSRKLRKLSQIKVSFNREFDRPRRENGQSGLCHGQTAYPRIMMGQTNIKEFGKFIPKLVRKFYFHEMLETLYIKGMPEICESFVLFETRSSSRKCLSSSDDVM